MYLAENLVTRGAEVVKAPENLRQGEKWRPQLKEAIESATHFIVILSAAAVQSAEVRKEIGQAKKRAKDSGFRILSIRMGIKLNLPPAVKFLDEYQYTPYGTPASILEDVAKTLELRPRVRLSGQTQTVIEGKTKEFVGRDWVFAAIDGFLRNNVSGYFTIVADPGMGKSSVLAEFVRRRGCLAHFNARQDGVTSARQFLENVCGQLVELAGLPYSKWEEGVFGDGAFLQQVLREAKEKLGTPIVIAVDALDEVDLTNHPEGANILFLPNVLAESTYFILTRRPMQACRLDASCAQDVLDLMEHPEENKADIAAYVGKAAKRTGVQEWIRKKGLEESEVVSTLVERSQSNFMYVVHVLTAIGSGSYESLEQIPIGLRGYYDQHWQRMGMNARPAPLTKIRIIGTIAAARMPLSRRMIARVVASVDPGVDEISVNEVLRDWKQFLHESQGPGGLQYSVYHASFLDFLAERTKDDPALPTMEELRKTILGTMTEGVFGRK